MKKLLFIEFDDEVDAFDKHFSEGTQIVALQPCVQVKLKQRGISFYNSIPFFGKDGHSSVLEKSNEIIELLRPEFILEDQEGMSRSYERTFFFFFRFYLHYWLSSLYIIQASVSNIRPDEVIVPSVSCKETLNAQINTENRLLGNIVSAYTDSKGISSEFTQSNNSVRCKQQKSFPNWLARIVFEILLVGYRLANKNKKILLVPADSCNIPRLLKQVSLVIPESMHVFIFSSRAAILKKLLSMISGATWLFAILPGRSSKKNHGGFKKDFNSIIDKFDLIMKSKSAEFSYFGVDLRAPLQEYIKSGLTNEMFKLNSHINALARIVAVKEPTVVFSQHSLGLSYALGELCKKKNIPAMLISHGSHVPQINNYANLEWNEHAKTLMNTDYPYVAAQTPWATKFLNKQKELLSKVVTTGPLLFAKKSIQSGSHHEVRKKLFPDYIDKTIVIHAGTPKPRNAIRPWVYETVDEYIENINELIRASELVKDVFLVVRFRPSSMLTTWQLKELLIKSDCYGVYEDGLFDEYLIASDLLVSYSSTTIEEALQNRVPVLQYDPDDKYCHIPAQKICKDNNIKVSPIYFAGKKEDLFFALDWINREHLHGEGPEEASWAKHSYCDKMQLEWLSEMNLFSETNVVDKN